MPTIVLPYAGVMASSRVRGGFGEQGAQVETAVAVHHVGDGFVVAQSWNWGHSDESRSQASSMPLKSGSCR